MLPFSAECNGVGGADGGAGAGVEGAGVGAEGAGAGVEGPGGDVGGVAARGAGGRLGAGLHLQLIVDVADPAAKHVIEAACRGGVDSIQIRSKGMAAGRLLELTREIVESVARAADPSVPQLVGESGSRAVGSSTDDFSPRRPLVFVNDRSDVALLAGADGVHLPEGSLPPGSAPRLREVEGELARSDGSGIGSGIGSGVGGKRFAVGRSIHGMDGVRHDGTEHLDYVLFGHVFQSDSKPGVGPRGLTMLSEIVAASPVPVLAVGGITADNVDRVVEAGARGVAVISAICKADDPLAATVALRTALDLSERGVRGWSERAMRGRAERAGRGGAGR